MSTSATCVLLLTQAPLAQNTCGSSLQNRGALGQEISASSILVTVRGSQPPARQETQGDVFTHECTCSCDMPGTVLDPGMQGRKYQNQAAAESENCLCSCRSHAWNVRSTNLVSFYLPSKLHLYHFPPDKFPPTPDVYPSWTIVLLPSFFFVGSWNLEPFSPSLSLSLPQIVLFTPYAFVYLFANMSVSPTRLPWAF